MPKGAHLSRGTPLSLGRRAVSLPQALGGQSRLTNRLQWLLLTRPPSGAALPCGLPEDCERRGVVLLLGERLQVRDEQRHIFERRPLVFLEIEAEPAGGEAP